MDIKNVTAVNKKEKMKMENEIKENCWEHRQKTKCQTEIKKKNIQKKLIDQKKKNIKIYFLKTMQKRRIY